MSLPTIASFWDGPPLGTIERLCLSSFVSAGHPVVLFSYTPVEGLPDGVKAAPASDILPKPEKVIRHERTGSAAIHADKFRYHLLIKQPGYIWADTDAYCLKPFEPKEGYFFGRETDHVVANGVLALPSSSPTLKALVDFCEDEFAIPRWMRPKNVREMQKRAADGNPMHVSEMAWGAWGPRAVSYFLHQNAEFDHALDPHVLYPVSFAERRIYFRPAWRAWKHVREDTVSIHFYGRRVRARLNALYNGVPPEGSILDELCRKHEITPMSVNSDSKD